MAGQKNLPPDWKIRWSLITKQQAAKWLDRSHLNRAVNDSVVDSYRRVMEAGLWDTRPSQSPIALDRDGNLINGQHRLQAIILSGKSVPSVVVRGVAEEAWDALDSGKVRSGYDVAWAGGARGKLIAPVLRMIWQRELGVLWSKKPEHMPSNRDLSGMLDEYQGVPEASNWAQQKPHTRLAACAYLHWALHQIKDAEASKEAEKFLDGIHEGTDLKKGSAALAARDMLYSRDPGVIGRFGNEGMLARLIKAWNMHLAGFQNVGRLTWNPSEEAFPPIATNKKEAEIASGSRAKVKKVVEALAPKKKEVPANA